MLIKNYENASPVMNFVQFAVTKPTTGVKFVNNTLLSFKQKFLKAV